MTEDVYSRIRDARLVWAMACPCSCETCDALYSKLQRIAKDTIEVKPGMCPYPVNGKLTEAECREAGQCGCNTPQPAGDV